MELILTNNYLPISTKLQIIETIKNNALTESDGMKFIDHIQLQIFTDISLLNFYFGINLDDINIDELYKDGTIKRMRHLMPVEEREFIETNVKHMLDQEVAVHNSLAGVINRNLSNLINRIPDEKGIQKIIKGLPKALDKVSPENLQIIKGIMDGNLDTPQPNREQRRRAAKDNKSN